MIKQLRFIPFILREIEDIDHIFAMDILMYLYKKDLDQSMRRFLDFLIIRQDCLSGKL